MDKIIGIYKITNPKGKIYIGLSTNMRKRFSDYRKLICKTQKKLYNSFLKYGVENHKFEIIQQCEKEQLNELEKYYVDLFKTFNSKYGLNLRDGGGSKSTLSEETKSRISESMKGDKNHFFGKKHSEEAKLKMSKALSGENSPNFGRIHSDETKMRMSFLYKFYLFNKIGNREESIKRNEKKIIPIRKR